MKTWEIAILIVVLSLSGIAYFSFRGVTEKVADSGTYDEFALCLTERGVVEYGAYWCPHCKDQKEMFGSSFKYVNYVECDPKVKNAQPELCLQNDIRGYPTWIIDGKKYEGGQSLEMLSELTGCTTT